jgi:septum formation protein
MPPTPPISLTPLILASASPRRRELLTQAGLVFTIVPSRTTEEVWPAEAPQDYVVRVAEEKAREVATRHPHAWILAADTIVEIDGKILGKPRDEADGSRMLQLLSGRSHHVMTAFIILHAERQETAHQLVTSTVTFKTLSAAQITSYLATGEPADKAGAYAVQGLGGDLVQGVAGSYTNVVGLPMDEVLTALQTLGLVETNPNESYRNRYDS